MSTMKDMNMTELNLDEMEMVNGGIDWDKVCGFGWLGGSVGMAAATRAPWVSWAEPLPWAPLLAAASPRRLQPTTENGTEKSEMERDQWLSQKSQSFLNAQRAGTMKSWANETA